MVQDRDNGTLKVDARADFALMGPLPTLRATPISSVRLPKLRGHSASAGGRGISRRSPRMDGPYYIALGKAKIAALFGMNTECSAPPLPIVRFCKLCCFSFSGSAAQPYRRCAKPSTTTGVVLALGAR